MATVGTPRRTQEEGALPSPVSVLSEKDRATVIYLKNLCIRKHNTNVNSVSAVIRTAFFVTLVAAVVFAEVGLAGFLVTAISAWVLEGLFVSLANKCLQEGKYLKIHRALEGVDFPLFARNNNLLNSDGIEEAHRAFLLKQQDRAKRALQT